MGCIVENRHQRYLDNCSQLEGYVGILKITINHIFLRDIDQGKQKPTDFFLKVWVSNQSFQQPLADILDTSTQLNSFEFIINSFTKTDGRFVVMELWNIKSPKAENVAYGQIDLQDIFSSRDFTRVYEQVLHFNYQFRQGGMANIQIQFKVEPEHLVRKFQIKLNSLIFRSIQPKNQSCSIKITAGEEVYSSPAFNVCDSKEPTNDVSLDCDTSMFRIPRAISHITIQLIKKRGKTDILVAENNLNLEAIFKSPKTVVDMSQSLTLNQKIVCSLQLTIFKCQDSSASMDGVARSPHRLAIAMRQPKIPSINMIEEEGENKQLSLKTQDTKKQSFTANNTMPIIQTSSEMSPKPIFLTKDPTKNHKVKRINALKNNPKIVSENLVDVNNNKEELEDRPPTMPLLKVGSLPPSKIRDAMKGVLKAKQRPGKIKKIGK